MNTTTQPTFPTPQIIKDIWLAMSSIYGHRWNSNYGLKPNVLDLELWSEGLEGLDEIQIKTGIKACFKLLDEWPPSLPQFRKLCLAIPSLTAVKQDMHQSKRSAFTHFVMGFLDHWHYRQADQYQAEKLLRQAYDLAVQQRMNGAPLPKPPTAFIEHNVEPVKPITAEKYQAKEPISAQAREKAIKEIREIFGRNR